MNEFGLGLGLKDRIVLS